MARYLKPAEAAKELGISTATITRCKELGAPVHYVGTCGRFYQIMPEEFREWMNNRGQEVKEQKTPNLTVLQLRQRRHAICG